MQFTPASTASLDAFLLIIAAVIGMSFAGVWYSARKELGSQAGKRHTLKFALKPIIWWGIVVLVVTSGAMEHGPWQVAPIFFALCNLAAIVFAWSATGGLMVRNLPLQALVGFQIFRLPLELVLHAWVEGGTIPATMTWTGANYDIVSGIVALGALPFVEKHRGVAWFANIVGLMLLLNVGRVAIMSSPLPFAWQVEPPLQLVFHFPYALIVPVCVAGALAGHIILTRRLLLESGRKK